MIIRLDLVYWRIDRGNSMKRWKKCSILIIYTVILGAVAGTAGYQLSEKQGQKISDNLFLKEESFRVRKGWDDLTPIQQKNAKYLFSQSDIERYDQNKDFDCFEKSLSTSEPYMTFPYGELGEYKEEQFRYGPVEPEVQGEKKHRDELVELAKKRVYINYTRIRTAKDKRAERWRITFENDAFDEEGKFYHCEEQSVYMCYDGTVTAVTKILDGKDVPRHQSALKAGDD